MQSKTVKCVGVTYTVEVPSTAAEFDACAKRENACVDEAVTNVIYRGTNPVFRDAYLEALCNKTGYERPTKDDSTGKKNDDGSVRQVFVNSEGKEIGFAVAQGNLDEVAQQAIADEVMSTKAITFDPSARERATKEPSAGKQDLEQALAYLTGPEDALKKVIKNIKKRGGVEVVLTGEQDADQKAIAAGIKAVKANLMADLAA